MLLEPTQSPYDLRFRLYDVPVRVHPSFWLFGAIFGWGIAGGSLLRLALWVACMFVSILVHEMGHIFMGRLAGLPGHVVLYSFGGLAIGNWHHAQRWQRIAISAAGPIAGLTLYAMVLGVEHLVLLNEVAVQLRLGDKASGLIHDAFLYLKFMNLFWNLLNLIPVYPLDGGQIAREIWTAISPRAGLRISLGLSFVLAGVIAAYSAMLLWRPELPYLHFGDFQLDPRMNILLFGLLAFQSYQMLQHVERERRRWEMDNNDW